MRLKSEEPRGRGEKLLNQKIDDIKNGVSEYICEVKGFKSGRLSSQFMNWFMEMKEKTSPAKEALFEKVVKQCEEVWEVIYKILISEIGKRI